MRRGRRSATAAAAGVLSFVLWAGCSPGGDDRPSADRGGSPTPRTVIVDGQTLDAGELADTVPALCLARQQASTDPRASKSTYDRRSRAGVETTTRALQGSYSILASSMGKARADVEADLAADPPRPSLGLSLGRLIETTREGLARLGLPTPACKE